MSGKEAKAVVPKLRFPEFREAGAWEEKEVGEIFKVTRGEVLSMRLVSDMPSETTPYPVYSSQTKNNGLSGYYSDFLYENAITWTTDGANAGDVNYRPGKFYCTNVCGVLINNDGYANVFIAELLNTITRKHVSYIGNPKLMNGVMAKIKIILPPLPEQQKIAHCLSSLDEVIGLQAKKVQALKQHKKGLMQQLFPAEGETTPRLRFPEFREAGAWEVKRLGEIGKISKGKGISKSDIKPNGALPCIRYGELYTHYGEVIRDVVSFTDANPGNLVLSEENDVIIPASGETKEDIATASCVSVKGVALGGDLNIFYSPMNGMFLAYYIRGNLKFEISKVAQGNSVVHLYTTQLEKLKLAVPPYPKEQQKIAHCLSSLDEVIGLESHKLDALKNLKKGLMQQLFPQEVA
ncbi:restriction endonuclease subunit S [Thiolapillus sp.]|uniref:restriction endonuclease subunit S n=11 Tax=Thiolapillus sp. TaxID=2017437 RepID=UPI003AF88166